MNENAPKLGTLIENAAQRDAVHVAIAPMKAGTKLSPGDHVGISSEGEATEEDTPHIGIVDPFLRKVVRPGETFWLVLYPGSVTNLRHMWDHPGLGADVAAPDDDDDDDGCRGC